MGDPEDLTEVERAERNLRRLENWRKAGSPPGPVDERYDDEPRSSDQ